jgi:hypothetical protein
MGGIAMKLRILVVAMLASGFLLTPTTASAKGVKDVTVSGPGLATPIRLSESRSANDVAQKSGFFPLAAGRLTGNQPQKGDLGPRYVAKYRWLVGRDETVSTRQELYPFADVGALTYTPPGQNAFNSSRGGGWYQAGAELTLLLVAAGVPVPPSYSPPVPLVAPPRLAG